MIEISSGAVIMVLLVMIIICIILDIQMGETGVVAVMGILICMIVIIENAPTIDRYHHTHNIEIHSTAANYNQVSGSFFLGTGYIDSEEMYAGNTFDGEFYERIYVPVKKVKRKMSETDTDVAIWHQRKCDYESTWLFKDSKIHPCEDNIKDVLEVPTGTIIKDMKFQ